MLQKKRRRSSILYEAFTHLITVESRSVPTIWIAVHSFILSSSMVAKSLALVSDLLSHPQLSYNKSKGRQTDAIL